MLIKFTDFEVEDKDIKSENPNRVCIPCPPTWTKVSVEAKSLWSDPEKLFVFLNTHTKKSWDSYSYDTEAGYMHYMVCFEDPNDALMFKLKGGHNILIDDE